MPHTHELPALAQLHTANDHHIHSYVPLNRLETSPQGVVRGPDLDREPRLSHRHESVGLGCHRDHAIPADHRRVRVCNKYALLQ
jgi:hypothetical protein